MKLPTETGPYYSFSRFTSLRVLDLKSFLPPYHTIHEHHGTVIDVLVSLLFHLKYFATG